MKKRIISLVLLGISVLTVTACAALQAQSQCMAEKIIRLHVVANSDSDADQAVKLCVRDAVLRELKATLRPELLNRMDEIVVFQRLDDSALLLVAALLCEQVAKRVQQVGLTLTVEDSALQVLIKDGADPLYGARPLRRAVVRRIEDELSSLLLDGTLKPGDRVIARARDGAVVFDRDEG